MKLKDLDELHQILHAALELLGENCSKDDPEEAQVGAVFSSCEEFKRMVRCNLDDQLEETGNGYINYDSANLEAEVNRTIKMTIKQFHSAIFIALSVGVDLGVIMARMGAKFPGAKPN